jgi:threonine/homoserine/homoserine lactone efflux protein
VQDVVVIFFSSMVIAYSGALMPGPMLAVVVAETPRQGARAGPLVVLGHSILELVLLAALVVGLGPLLEREGVQATLSLVGGVMLAVTGAAMANAVARDRVRLEWDAEAAGAGSARTVLGGVLSSLANPYWIIWWATIGLGLLTKAYALGAAGLAAFYVGHILGDLTWYSAVSGAIAAGRRWISARGYRVMIAVAAVFLLAMSAWFVVSGLRTLLG